MTMLEWLVAHQSSVQTYCWVGALGLVATWEGWTPRRVLTTTRRRWLNNIGLSMVGMVVSWAALPIAALTLADWAVSEHIGVLNLVGLSPWVSVPLAFLVLDAALYGIHRLSHASDWLWRVHKVHHADLEIDAGTSLRHHPAEFLVVGFAELGLVVVLGAPALAVLTWTALNAVVAVFSHGNVSLSPRWDRLLRLFLVTPDVHRVHHSTEHDEANSNFGAVVPWWDRLFGTYRAQPRAGHDGLRFGIGDEVGAEPSLLGLLCLPLRSPATLART